jgi:NAD(P)-dependent dehydrogenase (short-subunit alcohol dehydrogenase family)
MKLEEGKVAVVTGAASGIGFGLAERFARAGMHVVLADIDEAAMADAAARIRSHGVEALEVRTDVSNEQAVQALAAAALERFGAAHVVCNNAGVAAKADPWFGPLSAWEWVFGVNLWSVIHGVRAFLPTLATQEGGGYIVNTASMAGLLPGFGPSYDATKHAVVAISEDLYRTVRQMQLPIGVSVLCPGWVRTRIADAERNWLTHLGDLPPDSMIAAVVDKHLKRVIDEGTPPAVIADSVADAIEAERFWIVPHDDWLDLAVRRWHTIAEGANPVEELDVPGLPPLEEIAAEVQALLGGADLSGGGPS